MQRDERTPHRHVVTVVTVDDQPYFRAAARDVIAITSGFETVGEASSGADAARLVAELAPALAIVDLRMAGVDGVETTRRIKATRPETVVVLVSIGDVADRADDAVRSGAAALIPKQGFGPAVLRRLWEAHGGRGTGPMG